jgi:hypothetical protein
MAKRTVGAIVRRLTVAGRPATLWEAGDENGTPKYEVTFDRDGLPVSPRQLGHWSQRAAIRVASADAGAPVE